MKAGDQLRAVADPDAEFYEAFGIARGGMVEMFRPAVWAAQSRAKAKGHANRERSGDVWRMPGVFLVRSSEVLWAHAFRHAADHPEWATISERARAAL